MKSLTKKFEKLINERGARSSHAKNNGLSPHVVYGISSPTTATSTSKKNSRYAMTVSFYNPNVEKRGNGHGYPKESTVRHEVQKERSLASSPQRVNSPKRDPILLNNNEPIMEYKPTRRMNPDSRKMAMFAPEPTHSQRAFGEFSQIINPRLNDSRVEGRKVFSQAQKESDPNDETRRLRKAVLSPPKNLFDPIVEGDPAFVKNRRKVIHATVSTQTLKVNDRKHLCPLERGIPPNRGKVFKDSSFTLNDSIGEVYSPKGGLGRRFGSPSNKGREEMKNILEYSFSKPFRPENISPKVNHVNMSAVYASSSHLDN